MTITVSVNVPDDMGEMDQRKIDEWVKDVVKWDANSYVVRDPKITRPFIVIERPDGDSDRYDLSESGDWLLTEEAAEELDKDREV